MKDFLKKLIERKRAEIIELQARSEKSEDVTEVRAIGSQIEAVKAEINAAETQLKSIEDEERAAVPQDAQLRNGVVVNSTGAATDDDGMEYRKAFKEFILRGTPIPTELRADANTLTSDVTVIPTQLVNRIVEKMELVGGIIAAVTRTAFAGGVQIPTSSVKPVATWVAEGAGSDRQKKTTTNVTFTYHKLRCEISMSMEVGTMALSAFEAKFVDNVVKAMIKAIEAAIINGDGSGKPKGILAETPVTGQAVTGAISYAKLCECEGALPEEYEANAVWCMRKSDFMKFIGLVDADGQPIARVNYGIGGKPERYLLGRPVMTSTQAVAGKPFIFDFADYVLNTIYDMGISKKQDWDTEDLLTKAVMSVDGKVVDKGSLVTFEYTPSV